MIERLARENRRGFTLLLIVFTALPRLAQLALTASAMGLRARELAYFYDGLSYIWISRTFPWVYSPDSSFPIFYKPILFTTWFPAYPLLIRLGELALGDPRVSALAVSLAASIAAVLLFHRLAQRCSSRPALASLIFCVFPPTWLLCGSMAMVEPLFLCFFLGSLLAARERRQRLAAVLAGAAIITQKSGFLLLPVLWLSEPKARRPWLYLLALVPLALLEAYLCFQFHSLTAAWDAMREINGGPSLGLPFQAFLSGLFSEDVFHGNFWERKAAMAASLLFYAGTLAAAWRKRKRLDSGLVAWLAIVLGFNACLGGLRGYFPFPKYMTLAAPAAILLFLELAPAGFLDGGWALALAAWLSLTLWWNSVEIIAMAELILRQWPKGYFQLLTRILG